MNACRRCHSAVQRFIATYNRHFHAASLLIERKANPLATAADGGSVAKWAAKLGNLDVLELLLARDPDDSALHFDALGGATRTSAAAILLLVARGLDLRNVNPKWIEIISKEARRPRFFGGPGNDDELIACATALETLAATTPALSFSPAAPLPLPAPVPAPMPGNKSPDPVLAILAKASSH